ncbi:MAG: tetratricopeptide repeat protein [Candidatus Aminicenantes bacterium]|nr:tetratricopeptide repeat protein [Candidatus Aminicenantes bacterium]
MKYKHYLSAALVLLASSWMISCSGVLVDNQIHFGIKAAQLGLWEEAIFRWEKAIEKDPNSAAAYNNLAVAYEAKGLIEEAKKAYEKALYIQPDNEFITDNYEKFKKVLSSGQEKKDEKK